MNYSLFMHINLFFWCAQINKKIIIAQCLVNWITDNRYPKQLYPQTSINVVRPLAVSSIIVIMGGGAG